MIAEVSIEALKNAINTVKPIAHDIQQYTRFHVNGHIDVSATRDGMEKPMIVHVPAETSNLEGETLDILLNYVYMLDFLTCHPAGMMQLELQKPTKHVLTWNGTQPEEEKTSTKPAKILYPDTPGFVGVIMPMRPKN